MWETWANKVQKIATSGHTAQWRVLGFLNLLPCQKSILTGKGTSIAIR